jgi:hypothetical protein
MAQWENVLTRYWNVGTLSWERGQQPLISTDNLTVTIPDAATQTTLALVKSNTDFYKVTAASGSVNGTGNNTCITPSSGKKLRLFYLSYNPFLAVEIAFRFGVSGPLFLRSKLMAGGVISKELGTNRYLEGAVDEPLILNLSGNVDTIWNAFYIEV